MSKKRKEQEVSQEYFSADKEAYVDQTQLDFELLHRAIANNQITAYFEQ